MVTDTPPHRQTHRRRKATSFNPSELTTMQNCIHIGVTALHRYSSIIRELIGCLYSIYYIYYNIYNI